MATIKALVVGGGGGGNVGVYSSYFGSAGAGGSVNENLSFVNNINLIDSYGTSNFNSEFQVYPGRFSQSFLNPAGAHNIDSIKVMVGKYGASVRSGAVTLNIYAHSGVFGTSSVPTGSALATSDSIDASTFGGTTLTNFTFSGANRIALTPSQYYCLVADFTAVTGSGWNTLGMDTTSSGAPGNSAFSASAPYTTYSLAYYNYDFIYYVTVENTVFASAVTPVVVGAGGTSPGGIGGASSFSTITSAGGNPPAGNGRTGGSNTGYTGGTGVGTLEGGGGAGGGNGSLRNGGIGYTSSVSGASVGYAGGGASRLYLANYGTAVDGGGAYATNGTNGLGGGGGGGYTVGDTPGTGGSGVVIISYNTTSFGNCTGGTKTTSGSNTIHTFLLADSGTNFSMVVNLDISVSDSINITETVPTVVKYTPQGDMVLIDTANDAGTSGIGLSIGLNPQFAYQSFQNTIPCRLDRVSFYLKKKGSPIGNMTVTVRSHTGTFGTSSAPTGAVLATAPLLDVSTLLSTYQLITFSFVGAERILLSQNTYYTVVVNAAGADTLNRPVVARTDTNVTVGNAGQSNDGITWTPSPTYDLKYNIYGEIAFRISVSDEVRTTETFSSSIPYPFPVTNNPGTAVNDTSTGSYAWVNPENVRVHDDTYSSVVFDGNNLRSNYLKITNLGFSLGANTQVCGILVEIDRRLFSLDDNIQDDSVMLVDSSGVIQTGVNKAKPGRWGSIQDAYYQYGGSYDTWGLNLTFADVNSANFGAVLSVLGNLDDGGFGSIARADHIRMTVYYEIPLIPSPIDTLNITENVTMYTLAPVLFISVSENIQLSNPVTMKLIGEYLDWEVEDSVAISENISVEQVYDVAVSDSVGLSELLTYESYRMTNGRSPSARKGMSL